MDGGVMDGGVMDGGVMDGGDEIIIDFKESYTTVPIASFSSLNLASFPNLT